MSWWLTNVNAALSMKYLCVILDTKGKLHATGMESTQFACKSSICGHVLFRPTRVVWFRESKDPRNIDDCKTVLAKLQSKAPHCQKCAEALESHIQLRIHQYKKRGEI